MSLGKIKYLSSRTLRLRIVWGYLAVATSLLIGGIVPSLVTGKIATAAPSAQLNFQARLLTSAGAPVPDGLYNIKFRLYTAATGGVAIWTEEWYDANGVTAGQDNRVRVTDGYLSVSLATLTAFPAADWGSQHFITMDVGGSTQTATPTYDGEMLNANSERMQLTAVPYAFAAANVGSGDTNAASTDTNDVTISTGDALGATSNSGDILIDSGSATGTAGVINLGSTNASAINIGRSGITTTLQGNVSISGGTDYGVYYRDSSDNVVTTAAGTNNQCLRATTGAAPSWGSCSGTGDIIQDGNSFTAAMTIGTNDAYNLQLETGGTTRLTIDTNGDATLTGELTISGTGTSIIGGDLRVDGGDITTLAGDLTIAPAGADTFITGDLDVSANIIAGNADEFTAGNAGIDYFGASSSALRIGYQAGIPLVGVDTNTGGGTNATVYLASSAADAGTTTKDSTILELTGSYYSGSAQFNTFKVQNDITGVTSADYKLSIKNTGNTEVLSVTGAGNLSLLGTATVGGNANAIQLIVKGNASQSNSIQEWQDSTGSTLAWVDQNGTIVSNNNIRADYLLTTGNYSAITSDGAEIHAGGQLLFSNTTNQYYATKDVGIARNAAGVLRITDGSTGVGGLLAGNITAQGNTVLGDATSDTVTFTGRVNSNIEPSANDTYDLGSSALIWNDVYTDRVCFDGNTDCVTSSAALNTSGWTDGGAVVALTTGTDNVTIGSTSNLGKLAVDGDTDEVQLLVQGNATQTSDLFVVETSGGTDILSVDTTGVLVATPTGGIGLQVDTVANGNTGVRLLGPSGYSSGNYLEIAQTGVAYNLVQVDYYGRTTLRPVTDSGSTFAVLDAAGTNTIFSVDTSTGLIATSGSFSAASGLYADNLTLNTGSGVTYSTPGGASVTSKINIVNEAGGVGANNQVVAMGINSSSDATARVLSVFDQRAGSHQPSIAVFSPDENDVIGFSWEGSNSTAYLKTLGDNIGLRINTTDIITMTSSSINLVQNATASGDFTVNGNTTLGNASGDTLTFNASTLAIPNNLNVDSNTLFIDSTNNFVNIGSTTSDTSRFKVDTSYGSAVAGEQRAVKIETEFTVADTGIKQGLRVNTNTTNTSGAVADLAGGLFLNQNNGSGGSTTNSYGLWVRNDVGAGHTVDTAYGMNVFNSSNAGTLTTQYGIRVSDLTSGVNDIGIAVVGADTQVLWLSSGADNTDAANGIAFGASRDTNLYRSAANTLMTDDSLTVGTNLTVNGNTTFGDATSDTVSYTARVASGINPSVSATYDLGTSTLLWNDVFVDRICFDGGVDCADTTAALNISGWSDSGTLVSLQTATDNVTVGSSSDLSAALAVDGNADEIQLLVQANATQTSTNLAVFETSGGTDLVTISGAGNTAISTTVADSSEAASLRVTSTATSITNEQNGIYASLTAAPASGTPSRTYNAIEGQVQTSGATSANASLYAIFGQATLTGSTANAGNIGGGYFYAQNQASVSAASMYGLVTSVQNLSTGSITTAYGVNVQANTAGSGTIGTNYGVFVTAQTAGTSDYGIAIQAADTQTLWVSQNADNTSVAAGIGFGSSRDTVLYRSAANTLGTGALSVGANAISGTTVALTVNNGTSTGNIVNFNDGGTTVASIADGGVTLFKNTTDSTAAFSIQNTSSQSLFAADTTNTALNLFSGTGGDVSPWTTDTAITDANGGTTDTRDNGTAVYYNGYAYMIGGDQGGAGLSTVYYTKVNPSGSLQTPWTNQTPTGLTGRTYASAVAVNGYMYLIGGSTNGTNGVATVEYAKINMDGSLGTFSATTSLTASRKRMKAVTYNGYIYVAGGDSSNTGTISAVNTVYYGKVNGDGTISSWTTNSQNIPASIAELSTTIANGYMYILGGTFTGGSVQDELYYGRINSDGSVSAFTTMSNNLPANSYNAGIETMNGYLYLYGGGASGADDEVYYAQLNSSGSIGSWTTAAAADKLPAVRASFGHFSANGYIYAIGGWTGSAQTNTVYYTSGARLKVNGSLDLVGYGNGSLSEGRSGGNLTAGNTRIIGTLDVQDSSVFARNVTINSDLTVSGGNYFQRVNSNSTTAFQIQNSSSQTLMALDTSNTALNLFGGTAGDISPWTTDTAITDGNGGTTDTRDNFQSVYYNGYVYLIGGDQGSSGLSTVYYTKVNPNGSLQTPWTNQSPSGLTARTYTSAVAVNGYIYLIGGSTNGTNGSLIVEFAKVNADGSLGTFTATTSLAAIRKEAYAVTYNGYIYVVGGNSSNTGTASAVNTVYYGKVNGDGTISSWTTNSNNLPASRRQMQVIVANGYLQAFGGVDSAGARYDSIYYGKINSDGSVAAFSTQAASIPSNNGGGGAGIVAMNGYVYLYGGVMASTDDEVAWAPLSATGGVGSWTSAAAADKLPATRATFGHFAANGYMYAIGGWTGSTQTTSVYYTSAARVKVGASLDLVGYGNGNLTEGTNGGMLTAGNTKIVGTLDVQDSSNFWRSVYMGGDFTVNGYFMHKNATNSTSAFQVQSASSTTPVLNVDTTNARIGINTASTTNRLTINAANTANAAAEALIYSSSASSIGLVIQQNTAQTADNFVIENSSGTDMFKVYASGYLQVQNTADATQAYMFKENGGNTILNIDTTNERVGIGNNGSLNSKLHIYTGSNTSQDYMTIQGSTTLLHQYTDGSANTLNESAFRYNGFINTAGGNPSDWPFVKVLAMAFNGSSKGLVVQANDFETQTADLFQVRTNGATTGDLFVVTANGRVGVAGATTPSYDLSFGEGANRTVGVEARASNAAGRNLTVSAGAAGTGASPFSGGTLTLQGGAAGGTGNANGGSVTITGGAGTGTGVQGLVNLSPSAFTASTTVTLSANGSLNTLLTNATNIYSTVPVNATNTGYTLTVDLPTVTTVGRILYIAAVNGSSDFTLSLAGTSVSISMKANSTATLIYNGTGWTAAGASSSTDLQAAYNNTLSSAGGAEIVLNNTSSSNGLTIRNNASSPIIGGIIEAQTSIGSNLFSVNNNAAEYSSNGGAETAGASSTTFPASTWAAAPGGGTVARYIASATNIATGQASASVVTTATAGHGARNTLTQLTHNLKYSVSFAVKADATSFSSLDVMFSSDGTAGAGLIRHCVTGVPTYSTGTASQTGTTITGSGTTFTAGMVGSTFVFANGASAVITGYSSATSLTASQSQSVSSTTYGIYSAGFTVNTGIWSRVTCSFTAPSSGITSGNSIFVRQTDATARTFYIDNLSVTVGADVNHAVDGSVDLALGTNWTNFGTLDSLTRNTSILYDTGASVEVNTPNAVDRGVRNNMAIAPSASTQYLVTFYARSTNTFNDIRVRYSRDGGTNFVSCGDYNTQSVSTTGFTRITCIFTTDSTTATDADLIIDQPTGSDRSFYIDALSVTLNTNTANNVQIGGANRGGPTTLFTLDRGSSAPIAANNDAYLGSMYYDTTTGRIQCYEADGWGACGSAPDNYVNLNPEYSGAVLNGTGVGTMTADFCVDQASISFQFNDTLCDVGETRNFYKWTSPQLTQQTYSVIVSYQLPSTFKQFASDDTVQLTARVDNTTNAAVTYQMYRSENGAVTQCGSGETAVTTSANVWQTVGINGNESTSCGFSTSSANAFVIYKINVKANSGANAYISTLSFTTTGR